MRIAYADPPYPGQSLKHYGDHPDYAGEVNHADLIAQLREYDGWVLHTSVPALRDVLPLCPPEARVMAWVKPFAAFKRNVSVAYAWEPVIVRAARKPEVSGRIISRDYIAEPITMRRGLSGAKPESVCRWCFEVVGAEPNDDLDDLFPGTGAVSRAWKSWRSQVPLISDEIRNERDYPPDRMTAGEAPRAAEWREWSGKPAFDEEGKVARARAAGRRAVEKHGEALARLSDAEPASDESPVCTECGDRGSGSTFGGCPSCGRIEPASDEEER